MKTIHSSLLAGAIVIAAAFSAMPVQALDNPINPNAPSPHAGVAPGNRASGSFASRRPGNLPKYGACPHNYTGVTTQTP